MQIVEKQNTSQLGFPNIERSTPIKTFHNEAGELTGEIRFESGADGTWLQFDCECLDALPYCKAHCCSLNGLLVWPAELDKYEHLCEIDESNGTYVLEKGADGFCNCLDREKRLCQIHEDKPQTCREFHCTRGASQRGWKLSNRVNRHSMA